MAHFENRRFIVGGKPVLVLSGEVHYFRLSRGDWQDRIVKARQAGCNAVASYIPWIWHEEIEGDVDVVGRKRAEHDLGAFIDLCRQEGLWFIARPGPFVMGETKNEGIPDWVYRRCPEAVPTTWGGKKATSKTLSYLDPEFLRYAKRWYEAVMPVIAQRLEPAGGNVIAVQLDNEIGMLQCWTEEADLSEGVLCEFTEWVQRHHSPEELRARYPFDIADPASRAKYLWDGAFPTARFFHSDYTEFTRDRFARYAAQLREFAEAAGVKDVPFLVNIHGSGGGRATTFPIGISQTFRSYTQAPGYWGSSDHYLGELTRQNAQDLYFLNAFMSSVNRPEQPLSSVEFEAGTGDYGENGAVRQSGAATDFKARLSVVQGNRMLNHYLLAGGHNPLLERPKEDGNSRVGTTGGRHGFAAPIGPEGRLDPTYFALKETNETLAAVAPLLAQMDEEHDGIALAFVPDYYSTDVKRAGPMMELARKLEGARGPLEGLVRAMLDRGLSFPALNLQAPIPPATKCIALAAAPCLHREIQERLLSFVRTGGSLLLYGSVPAEDLEGRAATILRDELGIRPDHERQASSDYFPSLAGVGWAEDEPEVRVWQFRPFAAQTGDPFLRLVQTELLAGTIVPYGRGRVAVVTAELPLHRPLWRGIFDRLGASPRIEHDVPYGGLLLNCLRGTDGARFVSLINLDPEDKEPNLTEEGRNLFEGRVFVPARKAKLLPLNVRLGGLHILRSTAEICAVGPPGIAFRRSLVPERILIAGQVRTEARTSDRGGQSLIELEPGRGEVWVRPSG